MSRHHILAHDNTLVKQYGNIVLQLTHSRPSMVVHNLQEVLGLTDIDKSQVAAHYWQSNQAHF